MKRNLLLMCAAMMTMSLFAQEEDVTSYIQNAGFDEDLTFQADGSMKTIISKETSLSDRSWAYIAEDSSVYAKPKETSSQQRKDGRSKLDATNGFIGRVKGWEIVTNQTFPKCEWVYFGTIPYSLTDQAIPIADDGDTYLLVPAKPDAFSDDDNVGFAYLRAGWGGRAVYKQTVKLPCAKYRLEYWAININPNGTNGKNLSKVTCRKDTWEDETGFSDTEWTLHTIEFTPTAEFTMEFGFESSGGSGSNPFLCIDGIKLYKIGDAEPSEIFTMDVNDLLEEAMELGCMSMEVVLSDFLSDVVENMGDTQEEVTAVEAKVNEYKKALEAVSEIKAVLARMDNISQTTDYPGKADFDAAVVRIQGYLDNDKADDATVALILGAVAEANAAIKAYYLTQTATPENPADYTFLVQHPWFINTAAEPVLTDGEWVFPNRYDEETGEDRYKAGEASSPDLNSEGWTITGASGGDQRLNWQRERSCWNAWNSNFTTTIAVGQQLTDLPNGYYTVAADMITQSGYANGTQCVYGESTAEKKVSTAKLTSDDYDNNAWETVSMTADDKVLVVDGKLTIGAQGTGDGNASSGWFLVTNFKLYYLGEAPADALKNAFDAKIAAAKAYAEGMHFKGDKKAFNDSIAKYEQATDYIAAMTAINEALAEAEKSEAKYTDYLPDENEYTGDLTTKTLYNVRNTLKSNGGDGYDAAEEIMEFAYNYVMNIWLQSDTASYKYFDATVDLLKNYLNTYTPACNNAADAAKTASEAGKAALNALLAEQKAALTAQMLDKATVDEFVAALNSLTQLVEKQKVVDSEGTDYTVFIQNPNAEAVAGWDIVLGSGDGNGEKSGQWFDGSSTRYFDSYNSAGLADFSVMQLVKDLPNGTYKVGVYARTPAEGAYVCYAVGTDTTFVEIPLNYYTYTVEETGVDTTVVASDKFGPIWEAAKAAYDSGEYSLEDENIMNANDGNGRGWKHMEMDGIKVTNHELLIGTMCGTAASKTEKVFGGSWYSVGGWTLTLIEMGDNTGWEGPIAAGIETLKANSIVADGIYTVAGQKASQLRRGLNIIVRNGKAQKVLVK